MIGASQARSAYLVQHHRRERDLAFDATQTTLSVMPRLSRHDG